MTLHITFMLLSLPVAIILRYSFLSWYHAFIIDNLLLKLFFLFDCIIHIISTVMQVSWRKNVCHSIYTYQ